ncbi:MAG: hypothetical protein ACC628_04680 [Pirellulaceae bacterium]
MRTALIAIVGALLFGVSGCQQQNLATHGSPGISGPVGAPQPAHVGQVPPGYMQGAGVQPGPPTASYAYPYYTTRAPRDFLLDNPPSIGR